MRNVSARERESKEGKPGYVHVNRRLSFSGLLQIDDVLLVARKNVGCSVTQHDGWADKVGKED